MRVLIIVTRKTGAEFENYWRLPRVDEKYIKPANDRTLVILNGDKGFYDLPNNHSNEFCQLLIKKLGEYLNNNRNSIGEIGIIAHSEIPKVDTLQENSFNVVFNKSYSANTQGLCVAEFDARTCEGILPLDRLRDTIIEQCDKDDEFAKAFEAVWNFFLGDPVLEAILELLHNKLLVPPENVEEIENSQEGWRNELKLLNTDSSGKDFIFEWEKFKREFNKLNKPNPLGKEYVNLLSSFSKSLFIKHFKNPEKS